MNRKYLIVAMVPAVAMLGCHMEMGTFDSASEEPGFVSEESELVSLEASELMDEEGAPVAVTEGGLDELNEGYLSKVPMLDDGEFNPEAFGTRLREAGQFNYSGGAWGASYDVLVSGPCSYGYEHDYGNAYRSNGNGGGCNFVRWYTDDPNDCRMLVHVGVPPWKNGTCAFQVYEKSKVYYFSYLASNTNNAQQNTTNVPLSLNEGQSIAAGTCELPGTSASGDTYLRLIGPNGQTVAHNDDWCGYSSYMTYTVPWGGKGTYVLKAGCYASESCSGTIGYALTR